jgi:hypothetical protein
MPLRSRCVVYPQRLSYFLILRRKVVSAPAAVMKNMRHDRSMRVDHEDRAEEQTHQGCENPEQELCRRRTKPLDPKAQPEYQGERSEDDNPFHWAHEHRVADRCEIHVVGNAGWPLRRMLAAAPGSPVTEAN